MFNIFNLYFIEIGVHMCVFFVYLFFVHSFALRTDSRYVVYIGMYNNNYKYACIND